MAQNGMIHNISDWYWFTVEKTANWNWNILEYHFIYQFIPQSTNCLVLIPAVIPDNILHQKEIMYPIILDKHLFSFQAGIGPMKSSYT